jgi:predicted dehydrogenase
VLLDLGVHVLDLVSFVLDDFEYESVSATTRSTYGPQGLGHGDWGKSSQSDLPFDVEDSATARLRLRSGTIVNLDLAWAGPFEQDERLDVVVRGEKGALSLHSNQVVPGPGSTASVLETPTMAVRSRFEHFCQLIRGQASPVITVEEALKVQGVLDAIYTSAASGREVAIPTAAR